MHRAVLLSSVLTACTNTEPSAPTAPFAAYQDPCDLAPIATVDQHPGDLHVVVDDANHLVANGMDVTSLLEPVLCAPWQSDWGVLAAESGDWYRTELDGQQFGMLASELGDGDQLRLRFEMREQHDDSLYVVQGEVLQRSRSFAMRASMLLTGTDLALDNSIDQLAAANPGTYQPVTYATTYR